MGAISEMDGAQHIKMNYAQNRYTFIQGHRKTPFSLIYEVPPPAPPTTHCAGN